MLQPADSQSPPLLHVGTTSALRVYWLTDGGEIKSFGGEITSTVCDTSCDHFTAGGRSISDTCEQQVQLKR